MEKGEDFLPSSKVKYCGDPYEVCEQSDCLLILTEWDEFREADLDKVKKTLRFPLIIDGRNIYDPHQMHETGFRYASVGRSNGRVNGKH